MAKRKKRALKGFKSLEKQVELHKEKLRKAVEAGDWALADYYHKEIPKLEGEREKKKIISKKGKLTEKEILEIDHKIKKEIFKKFKEATGR